MYADQKNPRSSALIRGLAPVRHKDFFPRLEAARHLGEVIAEEPDLHGARDGAPVRRCDVDLVAACVLAEGGARDDERLRSLIRQHASRPEEARLEAAVAVLDDDARAKGARGLVHLGEDDRDLAVPGLATFDLVLDRRSGADARE